MSAYFVNVIREVAHLDPGPQIMSRGGSPRQGSGR